MPDLCRRRFVASLVPRDGKADRLLSAIMIYVGAVLISIGRYDFAKMIQVFTLIIFSITFSASVMTYCAFRLSVGRKHRS